jgi:hypothetical protein
MIYLDHAEMLARRVLFQYERGNRFLFPVRGNRSAEVNGSHYLSVYDYEIIARQIIAHAVKRARCAQYFFFVRVLDSDAEIRPVAEHAANRFGLVM